MGMIFIRSPGKKVNFEWFRVLQNKMARNLGFSLGEPPSILLLETPLAAGKRREYKSYKAAATIFFARRRFLRESAAHCIEVEKDRNKKFAVFRPGKHRLEYTQFHCKTCT